MPTLRVLSDGKPGEVFHLYKKVTSIGRSSECDIVLRDPDVAPGHCHIHFDGKSFHLAPMARGCKIFVNGKRKKKIDLQHQDSVRLGSTELRFSLYDEPVTLEEAAEVLGGSRATEKYQDN